MGLVNTVMKKENIALKRQIKSLVAQLKQAEIKAARADKFIGCGDLVKQAVETMKYVTVKNLTAIDMINITNAIKTLQELEKKVLDGEA